MKDINYQAGVEVGSKLFDFIHNLVSPVIKLIPGVDGNHTLHTFAGLTLSTQAWADLIVVLVAIVLIGLIVGVIAKLLFGTFFRVFRIAAIGFIAFGAAVYIAQLLGIGL
jgi:hypothetical protein